MSKDGTTATTWKQKTVCSWMCSHIPFNWLLLSINAVQLLLKILIMAWNFWDKSCHDNNMEKEGVKISFNLKLHLFLHLLFTCNIMSRVYQIVTSKYSFTRIFMHIVPHQREKAKKGNKKILEFLAYILWKQM